MIKTISFDWFNTLARFEPTRHQLYNQAFRELGVELLPEKVMRGIFGYQSVLLWGKRKITGSGEKP